MLKKQNKGVTLIELLLVMGLITMLFTIGGLSLSSLEKESQLDLLASEIKTSLLTAQSRTLNGMPAGVYFETEKFVLFSGDQFVNGNPENEVTDLPKGVVLTSNNFPSQTVTFVKITGYINNFSPPESVTLLEEGTGKTRKVLLNRLGVVNIQ